MELLLSTLAVAISVLTLRHATKPQAIEIRYIHTKAINPPLPPLPEVEKPSMNFIFGGYPYVN